MPQSFVQICPKWNEMNIAPRIAKRTEKGSDFISSSLKSSDISYQCYMSNATKFWKPQISLSQHSIIETYHFQKHIENFKEEYRGFQKPQISFFQLSIIEKFHSQERLVDFKILRFHFHNIPSLKYIIFRSA